MQSICQQEAGFCPFGPCSSRLSDSARNVGVLACQANTHCIDSDTGAPGYRCVCNQGYQGQPYLDPGCQDINECEDPNSNLCEGICTNTPGSYSCSCKDGYVVDEFSNGRGCLAKTSEFPVIKFSIGMGFGFMAILVGITWLYFAFKKRKLIKIRQKLFQQNGGLLLKQRITNWSFGDGRLSLEQYMFSTTYSGKQCGTDEQQNNSYMKMMTNVVGGGGAA
ncbi:unnamed protein product [Lactuca saligna]|uniref:EGF-like domain-containing protein n=1 Tax=Lactuca saligna TaxID=75948 RepID=A0AA36E3T5_LACSI|nr:unnamed protein product [Lactuca saligna]